VAKAAAAADPNRRKPVFAFCVHARIDRRKSINAENPAMQGMFALVTGALTGIDQATALKLARSGSGLAAGLPPGIIAKTKGCVV
jgi:hypothetical protein